MDNNFNSLRDLVLSMAPDPWYIEHKEDIMFELNHCELHKLDTYFFNLYNAGVRQLPNDNNSNILYLLGMTEIEPLHRINTVGGSFPD